jgi:SAM-dependent methyltransferase
VKGLFRRLARAPATAPPEPPLPDLVALREDALGQALLRLDSGLGLFRLAHLLDALRRTTVPRSVLSIGSGLGFHEAYLAITRPDLDVVGADRRCPRFDGALPNLRFIQGDLFDGNVRRRLPEADFVYSIECLEHIEDDDSVVSLMVSKLKPGGRLYLQVPFASDAELTDEGLARGEFDKHEHVRPGYSESRLRELAGRHGLLVESIAAAFRFPLQPFVAAGIERTPPEFLLPRWRQVLALVESDVRDGLAANRAEATAIKMLARRP